MSTICSTIFEKEGCKMDESCHSCLAPMSVREPSQSRMPREALIKTRRFSLKNHSNLSFARITSTNESDNESNEMKFSIAQRSGLGIHSFYAY